MSETAQSSSWLLSDSVFGAILWGRYLYFPLFTSLSWKAGEASKCPTISRLAHAAAAGIWVEGSYSSRGSFARCTKSLQEKSEPLQTLQMETYLDGLPPTKDGYTFANLGSVPAVPMARITSIEEREQVPSAGLFKRCHRMDIKCSQRCLISSWWPYFRRFWKLKEVGLIEESRSLGWRADLWKLFLVLGVLFTLWFLSIMR